MDGKLLFFWVFIINSFVIARPAPTFDKRAIVGHSSRGEPHNTILKKREEPDVLKPTEDPKTQKNNNDNKVVDPSNPLATNPTIKKNENDTGLGGGSSIGSGVGGNGVGGSGVGGSGVGGSGVGGNGIGGNGIGGNSVGVNGVGGTGVGGSEEEEKKQEEEEERKKQEEQNEKKTPTVIGDGHPVKTKKKHKKGLSTEAQIRETQSYIDSLDKQKVVAKGHLETLQGSKKTKTEKKNEKKNEGSNGSTIPPENPED